MVIGSVFMKKGLSYSEEITGPCCGFTHSLVTLNARLDISLSNPISVLLLSSIQTGVSQPGVTNVGYGFCTRGFSYSVQGLVQV